MTLMIDPHIVLQAHGEPVTPGAIDLLERAALVAATAAHAHFTPDPGRVIRCPYCQHGSFTDLNGARWRCYGCAGTGRIIAPRAPP